MANANSVRAASVADPVVPAAVTAGRAGGIVPSATVHVAIVRRRPPSINSAVATIAISPKATARKAINPRSIAPMGPARTPIALIRRVRKAIARSVVRRVATPVRPAATVAVASAAAVVAAAGVVGVLPRAA